MTETLNGTPRVNAPGTPVPAVPAPPGTPRPVSLEKAPTEVPAPAAVPAPEKATGTRTRAAFRVAVRHGSYVLGGTRITTRRAWDGRTTARYERMMRAAEAAGNTELLQAWEQRAAVFRAARHTRRMELLRAPERLARAAVFGTVLTGGGLIGLGVALAVATEDPSMVLAPTMATVEMIRWIFFIASVVWGPLLIAAPLLGLLALWNTGRQQRTAPQWALPAQQRDDGAPITPSVVVTALRDLGIAALRGAIKDMNDAGAGMLSPITIAGCGVEVDVTLPSGVSTEEIQKRRRKLAENLHRHEHEVFVTIPQAARTVRLWIADSGALDEPIGPSPLATDETLTANYRTGRAPWGLDLRGDLAALSLFQRHLLITGLSNQGKTASLRALALWLALDPSVEFRIADLKGVGDWGMFADLASVLIEGPTDGHVIDATAMLEEGVREMERRLLAPAGTTFTPLVLIVDEAQVAFMCPEKDPAGNYYGGTKATSRYFRAVRKIQNQGRAVDVLLWQGTQDPTNENLPKLVREGAHIRASLVVGTEEQAVMALGAKAVNGGAAPHKLRQGLDKGTVVVAGDGVKLAPGQSSITIRTHFIDIDPAEEIAERARSLRGAAPAEPEAVEVPDPLGDIAAVLGSEPRMRTQEVLQRLAQRDPEQYRGWTFANLTAVLEGADAPPKKTDGGRMYVIRAAVLEALADQ
ncbi:DNA segregation ATPase FtsK/SpoIIIE, S-DNA-T family [Streptomyces sp. WMMB 714]|uniref:cell division protein FtsK n=1 Tax=Streptomyces sp. WMMB 714 TaxID=1286822 RepID=UPI0005F8003C|nr:cell division protein FtsK [Streptomyces sp. WMMB 714]SCK37132.1 DNA segregation ATPase FtsK/SpoIIIE, S-DNA-T family [Streptomyces sp. WMMB 714]